MRLARWTRAKYNVGESEKAAQSKGKASVRLGGGNNWNGFSQSWRPKGQNRFHWVETEVSAGKATLPLESLREGQSRFSQLLVAASIPCLGAASLQSLSLWSHHPLLFCPCNKTSLGFPLIKDMCDGFRAHPDYPR